MKSLKIFTIICNVCLAEHLKAYTKGLQRQFPHYLRFCVFFIYLKSGLMNIFYQQAPGRAQKCLTVQQISGNSIGGNVINLARKIPIFFVTKHYVMATQPVRTQILGGQKTLWCLLKKRTSNKEHLSVSVEISYLCI